LFRLFRHAAPIFTRHPGLKIELRRFINGSKWPLNFNAFCAEVWFAPFYEKTEAKAGVSTKPSDGVLVELELRE